MLFVLRLLLNAAALFAAVRLVRGVSFDGGIVPFLGVALVFGVVNAVAKPFLQLFSLPLLLLTLGLFGLVINALVLWMTSGLSGALGLGFHVAGFWPAFWGGLVVSLVNLLLSWLVARGG
ncbi:MAG TPA: phage holin family protein [Anaeromyxobacteraceae bacterium]|nr:phage holin family protein [Anaeromyxobacteraceae bacterium]